MTLNLRLELPITLDTVYNQILDCINTDGPGFYAQSIQKKMLLKHKLSENATHTLEKIVATIPEHIKCAHFPTSAFELQQDLPVYYARFSLIDDEYSKGQGIIGNIHRESEEILFEIVNDAPGEEYVDSPVFTCNQSNGDLTLIGVIVSVGKALLINPVPETMVSAKAESEPERGGDVRVKSKPEDNAYGYYYDSIEQHETNSQRCISIDLMQSIQNPKTREWSSEKINTVVYQLYLIIGTKPHNNIHSRSGVSSSYTRGNEKAFYKCMNDEYLDKITTWTDELKHAKQKVDPKQFAIGEFDFRFKGSDFRAKLL